MIEINKENFEEICHKLNDMEFSDAEDKKVCEWFINKIYNFSDEAYSFEDEGYDWGEVNIRYFGCCYSFNDEKKPIMDIIDISFEEKNEMVYITYAFKSSFTGETINNQIRIPMDWFFNHDNYLKMWKTEIVKKHIKNIENKIAEMILKHEKLNDKIIYVDYKNELIFEIKD